MWFQRFLDSIPGMTVWLAFVFCIVGALLLPEILILVASLLALYSALRFVMAGLANLRGLRYIKEAEATDWRARYAAEAGPDALAWDAVRHVVIIPNYKEPLDVMRRTLDHLAAMPEAQTSMTIVLAMEAAEQGSDEKGALLRDEYHDRFVEIFYTVHPAGLPGEMQCKSANLAWAGRWIKKRLVCECGVKIDHIVVTSMDADTLWHPCYFSALTYHFATEPERDKRFWQAPIRYHGNIHQVNPLIQLVNAYSTAVELAYLAAPWWASMPISSYSLSLRLLDRSGYWDTNVIADEWHMYIKAFFQQNGTLNLTPIYLPFLASSVTGETFWQLCKNRYQQSLRHAWGSKEVGYTVGNIIRNPQAFSARALQLLLSVAHDILLSGAGWVIMIVGAYLPVILHDWMREIVFTRGLYYPPLMIFQVAFTLLFILGVVFWLLDARARPPRPAPPTLYERLLTGMSFFLLPVLTLIFVTAPILHAQALLMAGVPLLFKVTAKT